MTNSHVAGWIDNSPTPAQLKEFFAQIESGRITKEKLQLFLSGRNASFIGNARPTELPEKGLSKIDIEKASRSQEVRTENRQHRSLQERIKQIAQAKGFRAVIEQSTPDGRGRVDVSLELGGKKIACEVTISSTNQQDLINIQKCLRAGFDEIIICSPEKKTLDSVRALACGWIEEIEQEKVLFLTPEELFLHLGQEAAHSACTEKRIKGYNVKVQYRVVNEEESRLKREAVASVCVQAIRRQRAG